MPPGLLKWSAQHCPCGECYQWGLKIQKEQLGVNHVDVTTFNQGRRKHLLVGGPSSLRALSSSEVYGRRKFCESKDYFAGKIFAA